MVAGRRDRLVAAALCLFAWPAGAQYWYLRRPRLGRAYLVASAALGLSHLWCRLLAATWAGFHLAATLAGQVLLSAWLLLALSNVLHGVLLLAMGDQAFDRVFNGPPEP